MTNNGYYVITWYGNKLLVNGEDVYPNLKCYIYKKLRSRTSSIYVLLYYELEEHCINDLSFYFLFVCVCVPAVPENQEVHYHCAPKRHHESPLPLTAG